MYSKPHIVMLKIIFLIIYIEILTSGSAEKLLGEGRWFLISIGECSEKLSLEVFSVDAKKHKLNRTHDGLDVRIIAEADIDNTYGALIEVCKKVDGGCKPHQVITDVSMANLIDKYAEQHKIKAMSAANMDPPDFPIYAGEYEVKDYMIDYCNLPQEAVYGSFEANVYMTRAGSKVSCMKLVLDFREFDGDEIFCD